MSSLETTTKTDLATLLVKIGLPAIAAALEDFTARATKGRWSAVQTLEEIARLEQVEKTRRSLHSRLQRARLGRFKPLADFVSFRQACVTLPEAGGYAP
jgi:hypothetical protein